MKAYFLKATELNQKFTDARKYGRESSTINGLVKPSCLIIDEVGRCVFDKENTRMFFDVATVFMIKGNSYRGKQCETIALSAGGPIKIAKTTTPA